MRALYILFVLFYICSPNTSFSQREVISPKQPSQPKFIPNYGQISDLNYLPRPDVKYQVEGCGIFIRNNGISYVFSNAPEVEARIREEWEEIEEGKAHQQIGTKDEWFNRMFATHPIKRQQFDMIFLKSNAKFEIKEQKESNDHLNYYLPQCPNGLLGIHTYESIAYKNLYEGVDVSFSFSDNGLKYDIVVQPNISPNQIKMAWTGADSLYVDATGQLVIEGEFYTMSESIPSVYQVIDGVKKPVNAKYVVEKSSYNGFVVSFMLGEYDQSYALIIDPWVTNYGGSGYETLDDLMTDSDGNVYAIGSTASMVAISEAGYQEFYGGGTDAYVVKFNEAGTRIWGTYYGGENADYGMGIAVNSANEVLIVGRTYSPSVIASPDGYDTALTILDAFLVKFDEMGGRIWGTYYGGELYDEGTGLCIDELNNIYVTGTSNSYEGIASPGTHMTEFAGSDGVLWSIAGDAYLAKFNTDGMRLWGTYFGGAKGELGTKTAVDLEGNVYICGSTVSSDGISFEGFQMEFGGGDAFPFDDTIGDAFIAKFNPLGNLIWASYFGGEKNDRGMDIVTDNENNVYLTGWTESIDVGLSYLGFQATNGGGMDAYLVKFSEEGDRLWSTFYGGSTTDYGLSIWLIEETNNVIMTGDTYSDNLPVTDCAIQSELSGIENAMVAQFNPSGEIYCSTYFGVVHEENILVAASGCYLYLGGSSPISLSTPGAHQEIFGGFYDGFIAQLYLQSCGLVLPEIAIEFSSVDIENCNVCDGEATVTINSLTCADNPLTYDYIWSNGIAVLGTTDSISTISDLCPGDYWVKINQDCAPLDTLFFTLGEDIINSVVSFSYDMACVNHPVTFTNESTLESGDITAYNWMFGDGEFSSDENPVHIFTSPGVYDVTLLVENEYGCIDSLVKLIEIYPEYNVFQEHRLCHDSLFQFPDGTEFLVTKDTSYNAHLTSNHGCDSVCTTLIIVQNNVFSADTIYAQYGANVQLQDYQWTELVEFMQDTAIFFGENGCDSLHIRTYLIADFEFIPPNVFSPGPDLSNETFYFPSENILDFQCTILNRWGSVVYVFNSIDDEWNGTNYESGQECPDGTYFFTYSGTTILGESFEGQGTVQLIRD